MTTHGGKRKGAGRPKGKSLILRSFSLTLDNLHWLRQHSKARGISQAKIVNEALLYYRGVVTPDEK